MTQPSNHRLVTEDRIGAASGIASLDSTGRLPDGQLPADALTQAQGDLRYPQLNNLRANARNYGISCAGVLDDGPAITSALAALAPLVGTIFYQPLVFPPNALCRIATPITSDAAVGIVGAGRMAVRFLIDPSFPSGSFVLNYIQDGSSPVTLEGKVPQLQLTNFTIDGNSRSVAAGAINMVNFDRAYFSQVYVKSVKGSALKARCLRESTGEMRAWMCGEGATSPVFDFDETDATIAEGGNLNTFTGLQAAFNMGDDLRIRSPYGTTSRIWTFMGCFFHGMLETLEDYADESGNFSIGQNDVPPNRIVIDNARLVNFVGCRFHQPGRGLPKFWLSNLTAGANTYNSVAVSSSVVSYRGNVLATRSILSVDTTNDSLQVTGGPLTHRHLLSTGSRIQFTAPGTGSLPGGLSAATDYFVISVDDNNFKVATSRTNAFSNAPVDITSAGTGTLTHYDFGAVADPVADTLTITDHKLCTGARIQVATSGGSIPGGLTAATDYFAIKVDQNTIKLATTTANAISGNAIDITSAGATVYTYVQDFIGFVEEGILQWGSGNAVDSGYPPVRGYFRIEDTNTPPGTLVLGMGSNWQAGGNYPVSELASGGLQLAKIDAGLVLTRNNHALYFTYTDGTAIQCAKINSAGSFFCGPQGTATAINATYGSTGVTTVNAGTANHEGFRVAASGQISFFGHATSGQTALGVAATDLASVITLANNIRTALQANGLCA